MALEVEDNTGKLDAESYVSVADFRAYAAGRNIEAIADLDEAQCEAALRIAFTYVNTEWRYKSVPLVNDQAGEFPRVDLPDGMGRVFNTVPKRVKDAQCEAAIQSGLGVDLFVVAERGGQIVSESVGPISTTYGAGATAETLFQAVERLLAPFTRGALPDHPAPSYNTYDDTPPVFSVGMHDAPGVNDEL